MMRSSSSSRLSAQASQAILLLLLSISPALFFNAEAAGVHHLKWEIKYEFKSPDCFRKLAITINGLTPGPVITATQGDTLVIDVTNSLLTENVAIHWHGIRQLGTPWSDGTEGVTQCPILPGDTFTYRFVVDRAGTYMYHAHYGMQRSAGLHGLITVLVPQGTVEPFKYDAEKHLVLNDWWHKSTYELAAGLSSPSFEWVGEPQSLLINGRGKYDCNLAGAMDSCNMANEECRPASFTVVQGKTYRFRIASVASLSAFNLEIEGHNMTIVEANGFYVKPIAVKNLNIYSGETYSVTVKADMDRSRNYWVALNVVGRKPNTPTGKAILNYYPNGPLQPPPAAAPSGALWNDTSYRVRQSRSMVAHPSYIEAPPPASGRTIVLLNTQNKIDGRMRWALNNVSLTLPATPYLIAMKHRLRGALSPAAAPETYDGAGGGYDIRAVASNPNATSSSRSMYRLEFGSTVDVVLQNANTLTANNSETHPWHLHGHDMWVLGYGEGRYDPRVDTKKYNLVDPIRVNTAVLHPYGWTALRFTADNPGVWAFHCHVEAHFFMGMGVVFEAGVERVGQLPKSIMGCGESKQLIRGP